MDKIKKDFDLVLQYTQGLSQVNTDKLFEKWKINKARFMKAFGDELIWRSSEKITFSLTPSAKESKANEFIDYIYNYNTPLGNFLHTNQNRLSPKKPCGATWKGWTSSRELRRKRNPF